MPRTPLGLFLLLHQLQISSDEKNMLEKNAVVMPPPPFFFISRYARRAVAGSHNQPALIVSEKNLANGFGLPHFRNASAITDCDQNIPTEKAHLGLLFESCTYFRTVKFS